MIPILGIPIVNGFHWLKRLIDSIDFPIDTVIVLNNNSDDLTLVEDLNSLSNHKYKYIQKIKICHLPANIGVAAAWNLIIKSNINCPFWLISNHDIAFTPGVLEQFYHLANDNRYDIVNGDSGDFNNGSYELFLVKESLINKIGLFDENFYPAYGEDTDYIMRIHSYNLLNPNSQINKAFVNIPFFHGENLISDPDCYAKSGSQTARQNQEIFDRLQNINLINFEYMTKKWGDEWRITNPYIFPMNCENVPISYTSYDLNFCRSKYLDFDKKDNIMNKFYIDNNPESENGIIDTNKFIINSKSNSRIFVVDDFYDDPIGVRDFALSKIFFPGEGAVGHRTRKQFLFDGLKEKFEDIIRQKIPDHTDDGYGWRDIGINGRFQYCPAGTNLVYHCDIQRWAAMIFLTPDAPPSAGTSFFRHKETKIHHNSQIDWNTDQGLQVFNQKTFLDGSPYEKVDQIGNIFNRLVIFDGGLIHSASEYFGWDIYSSRLFHIFFFN